MIIHAENNAMNNRELRVLIIDDSENDALLIIRELKKGGYHPVWERVDTADAMKNALDGQSWEIILCDYKMPRFDAPSAIALLRENNLDIPVIIISGTIGEETAVACMRSGAQDYIMKANLFRLCPAISRELEETESRKNKRIAEEALRQSEEKYRTILESIDDGYYEVDLAGNFTFCNPAACRIHGYSREEMIGMNKRQYTDREYSEKIFETFNKVYRTGIPANEFDWQIIRKDGTRRYIEASVSPLRNASGKIEGFRGIVRDVTERRQAEEKTREIEERYRALFDRSLNIIYVIDFEGNFIDANDAALNLFGYQREDLSRLNITSLMDDDQLRLALKVMGEILETGVQEELVELRMKHKSGAAIFIETQGSTVISEGKSVAIQAIARDVTERKRADQKLRETLDSLKKAVGTTIQVLVSALESRDPYTAGHQFRVAHLACAIAEEMGLDQEKIDGIRLAGSIHDIGKLSIPAEILTKPTRLTDLEFSLIKEHPQSGYDMLKHVESPWPLSQVIYQHHERIDGTGYPNQLKGDEIMIEARIMAVADVVEAMASHRPYRASLGIEPALDEIKKNKGILYDDAAASACLKLFQEKGYTFPS